MSAVRTPFKNGRPKGTGRNANVNAIPKSPRGATMTYRSMCDKYNYTVLEKVYPWAKVFRAGYIVVATSVENTTVTPVTSTSVHRKILIVHQRESLFKGPPKGRRQSQDKSALHTATRELAEETGIDIFDERLGAQISPCVFAFERSEIGVEEVILYFVLILAAKPDIVVDDEELTGYEWFDAHGSFKSIRPVSKATEHLFRALEDVDFWSPIYNVKPVLRSKPVPWSGSKPVLRSKPV